MNQKNVVELYDTTLRDGAQQRGINLSVENKLLISTILDELGVNYIEGGYAGANPTEDAFFARFSELKLRNAVVTAFGNTRRAGVQVKEDQVVKALEKSGASVITLVGKASSHQVEDILNTSLDENIDMVGETINHFRQLGRSVFFDAEHFFDGWKLNPKYAIKVLSTAVEAGAERVVLCDTNGGTLPDEVESITLAVSKAVKVKLGIHAHNDCDTAVANSLAAVKAGAYQIQGCANGYGERTGNANLFSIIANLKLKLGVNCVSDLQLASLHSVGRRIAEIVNIPLDPGKPYIGSHAFAHKGGLHASAVMKIASSYEHVNPATVGNHNSVGVSDLAGKSSMSHYIQRFGLEQRVSKADNDSIVRMVKGREAIGFSYENSLASLELLVLRHLPDYKPPYKLLDFKVISHNSDTNSVNEATIKVSIDGTTHLAAGEGNGPVSALNGALKTVLHESYPQLRHVYLADYKAHVIDENLGTESMVRVLIESSDGSTVWGTVGSAANVIKASWEALADSYEWYIYKGGLKPTKK